MHGNDSTYFFQYHPMPYNALCMFLSDDNVNRSLLLFCILDISLGGGFTV